jgi:hypothetical protein
LPKYIANTDPFSPREIDVVALGVRRPNAKSSLPEDVLCAVDSSSTTAARQANTLRDAIARGRSFGNGEPWSAVFRGATVHVLDRHGLHTVQGVLRLRHRSPGRLFSIAEYEGLGSLLGR